MENLNILDIRSVIIEQPKASPKLSRVIRQAEKVSQVSSAGKNSDSAFYIETKKSESFLDEKNVKITKRSHVYKDYANTYSVEILNSFNPEMQVEDNEFGIRNKLIDLFPELRGFKFVTTLFAEF